MLVTIQFYIQHNYNKVQCYCIALNLQNTHILAKRDAQAKTYNQHQYLLGE